MLETLQPLLALGLPGLLIALAVLAFVFFAKRGNLVISGASARIANLVLSAILSGLDPAASMDERLILASMASIISSLLYEFGSKFLPVKKDIPKPFNK